MRKYLQKCIFSVIPDAQEMYRVYAIFLQVLCSSQSSNINSTFLQKHRIFLMPDIVRCVITPSVVLKFLVVLVFCRKISVHHQLMYQYFIFKIRITSTPFVISKIGIPMYPNLAHHLSQPTDESGRSTKRRWIVTSI